jgi:hypothetical protein
MYQKHIYLMIINIDFHEFLYHYHFTQLDSISCFYQIQVLNLLFFHLNLHLNFVCSKFEINLDLKHQIRN